MISCLKGVQKCSKVRNHGLPGHARLLFYVSQSATLDPLKTESEHSAHCFPSATKASTTFAVCTHFDCSFASMYWPGCSAVDRCTAFDQQRGTFSVVSAIFYFCFLLLRAPDFCSCPSAPCQTTYGCQGASFRWDLVSEYLMQVRAVSRDPTGNIVFATIPPRSSLPLAPNAWLEEQLLELHASWHVQDQSKA